MAGVCLDGVKRLVDVASVDEYIQTMCVCKRMLYHLQPCRQCKGNTHAYVVKILPKPRQLFNAIHADEQSLTTMPRKNLAKSRSAAADAYIVTSFFFSALPYDASDPHAEEFDVDNFRCKCGKFWYNSKEKCTKNRCEYAAWDSKI